MLLHRRIAKVTPLRRITNKLVVSTAHLGLAITLYPLEGSLGVSKELGIFYSQRVFTLGTNYVVYSLSKKCI